MKKPFVTILVTTRNVGKYIEQCLDSVFSMSYQNIEVLVVDGNSSDDTVERAKKFPIKLIEDAPSIPKAYNKGIAVATGKYVFIVNGDSIVSKKFLQKAVEVLESNTDIGIVGGIRKQIISNNIVTKLYQFRFYRLDKLGFVPSVGGNFVINRCNYNSIIDHFDEKMASGGEERYIAKQFSNFGLKILRIDEISMIHLEDTTNLINYWKKHVWYTKGKISTFFKAPTFDFDYAISFCLYFSILGLRGLGKFTLIILTVSLFTYFLIYALKFFPLSDSLKISFSETISTLLRSICVPVLFTKYVLKNL